MCSRRHVFSYVGCLSLSGFDKISVVVFEAGASQTEKAEQERKRLQKIYIFVRLTAGSQNVRERECVLSLEVTMQESEFLEDESIYRQSLSCSWLQMRGIKVADIVVSTNHVTFLTNRFPRLISLLTSAIFVSGTSGITAILKYVNPTYIYF